MRDRLRRRTGCVRSCVCSGVCSGVRTARVSTAGMSVAASVSNVTTMSTVATGPAVSSVAVLTKTTGRHCDEANAAEGEARQVDVHSAAYGEFRSLQRDQRWLGIIFDCSHLPSLRTLVTPQ